MSYDVIEASMAKEKKIAMDNLLIDFVNEPFSKREAYLWIVERINGLKDKKLSVSIRTMAYIWCWHRSKVERFISVLKEKAIIETEVTSGRTSIMLGSGIVCRIAGMVAGL